MSNTNTLKIFGGFAEGPKVLDDLAQAALEELGVGDVHVFSLRELRNTPPHELRKRVGKSPVLTHSAGIIPLTQAGGIRPSELMVVAGPERTKQKILVGRGIGKTARTAVRVVGGPDRSGQAKLLANMGLEFGRHTLGNLDYMSTVSKYSTREELAHLHAAGVDTINAVMDHDEFGFGLEPSELDSGAPEVKLPGHHDDLLINPKRVLSQIRAALEKNG